MAKKETTATMCNTSNIITTAERTKPRLLLHVKEVACRRLFPPLVRRGASKIRPSNTKEFASIQIFLKKNSIFKSKKIEDQSDHDGVLIIVTNDGERAIRDLKPFL